MRDGRRPSLGAIVTLAFEGQPVGKAPIKDLAAIARQMMPPRKQPHEKASQDARSHGAPRLRARERYRVTRPLPALLTR